MNFTREEGKIVFWSHTGEVYFCAGTKEEMEE